MEEIMDKLLILSQCASGFGVFLIGVGALLFGLKQTYKD
jgi:hypothetical protein